MFQIFKIALNLKKTALKLFDPLNNSLKEK